MADRPRPDASGGRQHLRRHSLPVRLWHWTNAVTLLIMLMSGLMIFNAHPRLYWGEYGANFDRAWLEIGATESGKGLLRVGRVTVVTTGVLGVWTDSDGVERRRAFPGWATIPSRYDLADARLWHLAFAWILAPALMAYWLWSLLSGHARRDLGLARGEWRAAHIGREISDHLRLRFDAGGQARRYNTLQKLAYIAVVLVILPAIVLTGLAMSPAMDAAWPWLSGMFGGRQSARSVHFLCAAALAAFTLIHLVMVLLSGPINSVRAMITGTYRDPAEASNA